MPLPKNSLLRKGREYMKKIMAIFAVVMLVGCMAFVFSGCGGDENDMSTTTPTLTTTRPTTTNPGMVTDVSETDDSGVLGELATDISEGLSEMMTDTSTTVSDVAN